MLTSNGDITEIPIQCGILQGGALSPVTVLCSTKPATQNHRRNCIRVHTEIHHLLYMDDLKLHGKKEREIDSVINIVRIYSDETDINFGLKQCVRLIVERAK